MKKQYIITEAKQIKTYIEKNKKIPKTNSYADGKIYSIYTTSYLMANLIRNWSNNDISKIDIIIYDKTNYKDIINEKILKEDYLQMIKKFLDYCKLNRRVPTYIVSIKSNTKVSFELFVYCLAKIIVYYAENNSLPNYCLFNKEDLQNNKSSNGNSNKNNNKYTSNCTNPYKSTHSNLKGCNGMGQNTPYYCGVSALHKVLYKFGIKQFTQNDLAKVCGTTSKGTSHNGIRTGVAYVSKKTGIKLTMQEYNFSELGFEKLGKIICQNNKDAIIHLNYRNKYGHYEVLNEIDVNKKQVKVVNSLGDKCGTCYCGYIEDRSFDLEKQYINGISQKSVLVITKG